MNRELSIKLSNWLFAGVIASVLLGCSPEINHRGYIAKPGAFAEISEGMNKSQVVAILGSPSTTASINFQGDSYYYITSTTQGRAFLKPVETSREVIAVRFDRNDQVQSTAQYGLEEGRIIDINTRKTVVNGSETGILKQLFRALPGMGPSTGILQNRT